MQSYVRNFNASMKIGINDLRSAENRDEWRSSCYTGVKWAEEIRGVNLQEKRIRQKNRVMRKTEVTIALSVEESLLLTAVAPIPSNWQSAVVAETGKTLNMQNTVFMTLLSSSIDLTAFIAAT